MKEAAPTSWLVPISALLGATFAVVSAELMISGLLPAIASDVGVDIPTAGLLITGYAVGVAVADRSWRSSPRQCRARRYCCSSWPSSSRVTR